LEVDSDNASYKQKLEVLQQQEELIEDEQEQEQREEDARRAKKEEEARLAESLLPDSEVRRSDTPRDIETLNNLQLHPERIELEDARMTTEQLKELAEALSVVSAQSSVLKERHELRALMEENLAADEVSLTKTQTILSVLNMLIRTPSRLRAH
jgi:LETM1 and EF-hand domain-containing protein 1